MTAIVIPPQLRDVCKVIRLKRGGKEPIDKWSQPENQYDYNHINIVDWLHDSGNYGIIPRDNVCILDADEFNRLDELGALDSFKDTFTVRTGNPEGTHYHYFFKCSGLPEKKIPFFDTQSGDHLGELYPAGCSAYVVGPGCLHPSGNTYQIIKDVPLKVIRLDDLDTGFFSKVKSSRSRNPPSSGGDIIIRSSGRGGKTLTERYQLSVRDHYPTNARQAGDEIRGAHPVHGSTTGENCSINTKDNVFRCFRCNTGGDAAIWDAINRGIIECHQDYDDVAFQKHVKELERDFPDVPAKEKEEYFNRKKAEKQVIQSAIYEPEVLKEKDNTPLSSHHLGTTDAGNADRFLRKYKDKFVFCPFEGKNAWYFWDKTIWKFDNSSCTQKAAIEVIKDIYAEAKLYPDEADRKKIAAWAMKSEGEQKRRDMITTAGHALAIPPDRWNNQPNLLNLQNGTLELDTLKFREFRQDDYLTLQTDVKYDPIAKCPEWEDHLNLVFGGNSEDHREKEKAQELIASFQLLAGYSILSGNPGQIFIVLHGGGDNGKSVTVNTLRMVLGDYGTHIKAQTLMQQRNPDKARSDLVRLRYKRLVTSTESKKGERLDVGLIKELSGGEPLVCRDLYKSEVQFDPEFVIWFSTNDLPDIGDTSHSIWRRIWVIPFNQKIPADKKILDYEKSLVESEGSGILNWMLQGLKLYYNANGLIKPKAVEEASSAYQQEEDPMSDFIEERCMYEPGKWTAQSALYSEYLHWCKVVRGIRNPMSSKAFSSNLKNNKQIADKRGTGGARGFTGIRLKSFREAAS